MSLPLLKWTQDKTASAKLKRSQVCLLMTFHPLTTACIICYQYGYYACIWHSNVLCRVL